VLALGEAKGVAVRAIVAIGVTGVGVQVGIAVPVGVSDGTLVGVICGVSVEVGVGVVVSSVGLAPGV
jgi:hypothetical protein